MQMQMQIIFGGQYDCYPGEKVTVASYEEAQSVIQKVSKNRQYGAWGIIRHDPPLVRRIPERKDVVGNTIPETTVTRSYTTVYGEVKEYW